MAGKTFTSTAGVGLTGTMVNRGTLNWNPTSNTTQTVQPGYYSGGTLNSAGAYNKGKTDGVAASKVGTATAANVLAGKTFTNASTVGATGTMKDNGAWTNTPTAKGKVTIPAGYHNGSGYIDTTNIYEEAFNKGIYDTINSGALHSDYMELILVVGYADRNANEPYVVEVVRHIIHNKNNIPDQQLLSGSGYYSSGWKYTITTNKDISGEYNFTSSATTPRTMNIWGRIAWL